LASVRRIDIRFERGDKGLGLSIAGGLGSTPYKPNDEGIFISRVTPGGPASIAGLSKDDKVYFNCITCYRSAPETI
jgi:protein scribble